MKEPFVPDKYYHIYNRGNNGRPIFLCAEDYNHFLHLYSIYAHPVLETLSWCLMKNHYHFCIRFKNPDELGCYDKRNRLDINIETKWKYFSKQEIPEKHQIVPIPLRMLGFMFDAYSKYFNIKYSMTGAVFERGIERKPIESENYLTEVIIYIHNNPVRHGITKTPEAYKWSSYNEILNGKSYFCSIQRVTNIFDDSENFVRSHKDKYSGKFEWGDF